MGKISNFIEEASEFAKAAPSLVRQLRISLQEEQMEKTALKSIEKITRLGMKDESSAQSAIYALAKQHLPRASGAIYELAVRFPETSYHVLTQLGDRTDQPALIVVADIGSRNINDAYKALDILQKVNRYDNVEPLRILATSGAVKDPTEKHGKEIAIAVIDALNKIAIKHNAAGIEAALAEIAEVRPDTATHAIDALKKIGSEYAIFQIEKIATNREAPKSLQAHITQAFMDMAEKPSRSMETRINQGLRSSVRSISSSSNIIRDDGDYRGNVDLQSALTRAASFPKLEVEIRHLARTAANTIEAMLHHQSAESPGIQGLL